MREGLIPHDAKIKLKPLVKPLALCRLHIRMEQVSPQSGNRCWPDWMARAASAAASIQHLPAIACADWGEQAAERLGDLPGVLGAVVLVARAEGVGDPLELDAVGVQPGQSLPGQLALSENEALTIRSRLESLAATRNLKLGAPSIGAEDLWGDQQCTTLQTWVRIGNADRVLIAMLAVRMSDEGLRQKLSVTLDALTPLLAQRACVALGAGAGAPTWLTSRERLVLEQLILGKSVREIADLIDRSPHTVHDHVKNLHRKLGASSRGALIARALGRGCPPQAFSLDGPNGQFAGVPSPGSTLEPKPAAPAITPERR